MKPKPILFSTDMVQAILDGRKTQTRRVIKPQTVTHNGPSGQTTESIDEFINRNRKDAELLCVACAPYQPGDILWVRETWMPETEQGVFAGGYIYRASSNKPEPDGGVSLKWRPSIHMPREAARLSLRVKDVRVERLQEISDKDILSEGINDLGSKGANYDYFANDVWDTLNAKRGYGWDTNPWVWVIEFERVERS